MNRAHFFGFLIGIVLTIGCKNNRRVQFWSDTINAVQFPVTNSARQKSAVLSANPFQDVDFAMKNNDWRFIAEKVDVPNFVGLPYDGFAQGCVKKHGYKVIAVSTDLVDDEAFQRARKSYVQHFNASLYKELKARQGSQTVP